MARKENASKIQSSAKLMINCDLKLLYMIVFTEFLLARLVATDNHMDNHIPTDDMPHAVYIEEEDFSRTSSEHYLESNADVNLDETGEELRTSLSLEDSLRTSPHPEDSSTDPGENLIGEDYNAIPETDNPVPLDWTNLDKGLKDLHSLINQIDESSQSQNESRTSSGDSEDELGKPKYPCSAKQVGNDTDVNVTEAKARIVNATEMLDLVTAKVDTSKDNSTNNTTEKGHCIFVMFYAPWCKFSAASAPHFNAIGRAFADIDVIAVDAFQFRSLNARYGTVSVPNFLFFYNSKPVLRYNYSERNYETFTEFIHNHTGLIANASVNVTDIDYVGPVPSLVSEEPDYALWFSGIFLLAWFVWIMKVQYGTIIAAWIEGALNYVRHIWRTGEFYEQVGMHDHEHVD